MSGDLRKPGVALRPSADDAATAPDRSIASPRDAGMVYTFTVTPVKNWGNGRRVKMTTKTIAGALLMLAGATGAGCGGGPEGYTCAELNASSEKTTELAEELVREWEEVEWDAARNSVAYYVRNIDYSCAQELKADDRPYGEYDPPEASEGFAEAIEWTKTTMRQEWKKDGESLGRIKCFPAGEGKAWCDARSDFGDPVTVDVKFEPDGAADWKER